MSNGSSFGISNGQDMYMDGEFVWVEVSPVEWLVDVQSEQLVAKKGLLSGIKFNSWAYKRNFVVTDMYHYMNKYLLHDLFQGLVLKENIDLTPRVVTDAFSYEEDSNRSR